MGGAEESSEERPGLSPTASGANEGASVPTSLRGVERSPSGLTRGFLGRRRRVFTPMSFEQADSLRSARRGRGWLLRRGEPCSVPTSESPHQSSSIFDKPESGLCLSVTQRSKTGSLASCRSFSRHAEHRSEMLPDRLRHRTRSSRAGANAPGVLGEGHGSIDLLTGRPFPTTDRALGTMQNPHVFGQSHYFLA